MSLAACAAEPADDDGAAASDDALSAPDPVLKQALADHVIGERATGYLGVVENKTASRDITARIGDINIKRRAVYTDLSVRRGVTVQTVARSFACQLFTSSVKVGQAYEDEEGTWRMHTKDAPTVMPSFCSP